ELDQQFEKERLSLEEQKTTLRQQLDELREELTSKLNAANDEVAATLRYSLKRNGVQVQEVQQGEQDMGTAEGTICTLKEAQDKLLEELDATRARLRETSNLLTALQECKKLREELREDHEEDKALALSQLAQSKEQELSSARESWQRKVEDLLEQISLLKQSLEMQLSQSQSSLQQLQQQFSQEREHLRLQLDELQTEHQRRQQRLQELHLSSMQDMEHARKRDLKQTVSTSRRSSDSSTFSPFYNVKLCTHKATYTRLEVPKEMFLTANPTISQSRSIWMSYTSQSPNPFSDAVDAVIVLMLEAEWRSGNGVLMMASLRDAHRQSIETLKQQSEQELQTLRFELEDEGKAMLASLRSELNHIHASAIEHLRQTHQQEAAVAKLSLEKTLENNRTQERELLGRITELQEEVSRRKSHVAQLDHQIHTLNENISTLTKELELKGKEVLKIRSEANQQIRAHEQELTKRHERELAEMSAVHSRETQNMLSDFNKAQEVLKDKISALQILLEGTEDKFRNRESRHEDLQVIAELKDMVSERESLVKKLVDDKKYYQLELVNRETNFNKVFNASPNVGVINPLIKQKKKNEKAAGSRFSSSPSVRALEAKFMSPPETKDSAIESPDAQRQEWFAQYFSF
ncbi:Protein FAM184A, partial [Dissostichus eleginoides]